MAGPRLGHFLSNDRPLKRFLLIGEATDLDNFRQAEKAEYRHCDNEGCLKGTRSAVLDKIELWTRDHRQPPVYWLNGLAGTGKTTIAQTIAARMFAQGRLGASFFCSRNFEDQSDLNLIFPTLAVQLARNYPEFRSIFVPLVRSDPKIAYELPYGQMDRLIVQPLVKARISTVIVIDALDECKTNETASKLLSAFRKFAPKMADANVKFLITGRPEPPIREGFQLLVLAEAADVFVLHKVEPDRANNDVRLFFIHSFLELKRYRCVLGEWPTEEQLDLLCQRSAGFFIHATATIRFIGQKGKNPKKQLNLLLQSSESGLTELKESKQIDLLYGSILQGAFSDNGPEDDSNVRSVLGAVVLVVNPLSPSTIAALLGLDPDDVSPILFSTHSLLVLREDIDHPVRPFHKSFSDFIINPARCTDPRFRVRPSDQHARLLVGCLELMNRMLEQNMCQLPDGVTNSEVGDLKERAEQYIGEALQYACRSWHKHIVGSIPTRILEILHQFLATKFLFWLEVLSVLGAPRDAVDALDATVKWLDVRCILITCPFPKIQSTFFRCHRLLTLQETALVS